MSHSIITLKLILATVGIIDPLNVCHSAPVKSEGSAVNKHTGLNAICITACIT